MAGTNEQIINQALKDYEKYILDTTERELRSWCWYLLDQAIRWRQCNPDKHNFTGNLLNSIVVCLYREKKPVIAYFAYSLVPEAIHPKMSVRKRRAYHFDPDYEGVESEYRPSVKTNKGWGRDDAREFFWRYVPDGKNLFDIVVAYPVEYANFIEMVNHTTGILQTRWNAKMTGAQFMQIA